MFCFDALKAVAILLVTHSHMEAFYPVPALATGGLLGNTLFFLVSGMLVAHGLRHRPEPLVTWYRRRLRRLYLPLWLTTLAVLALGMPWPQTPLAALQMLVAPADYWFLPAIAVFYPLCHGLASIGSPRLIGIVVAASLLAWLVGCLVMIDLGRWSAEDHVLLKCIFYFAVMAAGLRMRPASAAAAPLHLWLAAAAATAAFVLFLLLLRISGAYVLQCGAQLLALASAWSLAICLGHPGAAAWVGHGPRAWIAAFGGLSLEIYLVQVPLLRLGNLQDLPFPLGAVLFWTVLILLAWLLKMAVAPVAGRPRSASRPG